MCRQYGYASNWLDSCVICPFLNLNFPVFVASFTYHSKNFQTYYLLSMFIVLCRSKEMD